jgi:putative transposase
MLRRHEELTFARSIHFVTTVTSLRGDWFRDDSTCTELLKTFEGYRGKFGLHCLGYVLMPDHVHALLYQTEEGSLVPNMMQASKRLTSSNCRPPNFPEKALWRRRYDDVPLPGTKAAMTRLHYMHGNPVRRGLVEQPENYRWSSARDYAEIEEGIVRLSRSLVSPGT